MSHEPPISEDLIALLDTAFVESFPCAPRLLSLIELRGWTGWTDIRRTDPSVVAAGRRPEYRPIG